MARKPSYAASLAKDRDLYLRSTVMESCVMSRRFVAFTVYDIDREREEEAARSRPIETDYLTPSQQMALLIVRKSDLSKLVLVKLYASTVRAGAADFEVLMTLNLVKRKAPGIPGHDLLPHGLYKADDIARKLAHELGVRMPEYRSLRYQKSRFGSRGNGIAHSENW